MENLAEAISSTKIVDRLKNQRANWREIDAVLMAEILQKYGYTSTRYGDHALEN